MKLLIATMLFLGTTTTMLGQDDKTTTSFGVEVSTDQVIEVRNLVYQLKDVTTIPNVTLTGKVVDVCKKKGCWMKLENPQGEPIHVMFKDYGLFMPKDLVGKSVIMHGKGFVSTTSVEELRHYAEDAGKSKAEIKKINSPKKEVRFEADGVKIITN